MKLTKPVISTKECCQEHAGEIFNIKLAIRFKETGEQLKFLNSSERDFQVKKNILAAALLSFIFAFSLLINLKLAVGLLLMIIYLSIIIKNAEAIIKTYFFIYLVLAGFANEISISLSGSQSINLLGIINLIMILFFYFKLMDFLQLKKEHWNKSLLYPIFIFMLYLMVTAPLSISLIASIRALMRILSAFCFYLLAYFIIVNSKDAEKKIFKLITAILIPITVYGIIEYFTGFNIFRRSSILYSAYQNYEVVATFRRIKTTFLGGPHYSFVILTFLPLYLYYFIKKRERTYFYGFIISLLLINLILTFTRITWLAVAIQLIFFLILFRPKKMLRFALPLGIFFVFMLSKIITRATTVDGSALERIELFLYGLNMFKAHPVFGSGIGTILDSAGVAAHGDYIRMFAETGIFGGLGYLILLSTNLTFTVKNFKQNDFAKISFLTIIGFMIFSLTDNGLAYSHIFWALLGIYNGLIVREKFDGHPFQIAHSRTITNRLKQAVIL